MEWTLDPLSGVGWGLGRDREGAAEISSAGPEVQNHTQAAPRETVLPGAGWKTNRAQAVVTGSQGQLDVNAL